MRKQLSKKLDKRYKVELKKYKTESLATG